MVANPGSVDSGDLADVTRSALPATDDEADPDDNDIEIEIEDSILLELSQDFDHDSNEFVMDSGPTYAGDSMERDGRSQDAPSIMGDTSSATSVNKASRQSSELPSTATCTQAVAGNETSAAAEIRQRTQEYNISMLNKNTVRGTNSAANKFEHYLQAKGCQTSMLNLDLESLDSYIAGWILDLRKADGQEFEPSSLTSYLANLNRYFNFKGKSKKIDIIKDKRTFELTHQTIKNRKRDLKRQGKGNLPNKASGLENDDEEKLWSHGCLGDGDPETLLHTIWYFTTKMLGFRGNHEARQLKWGDFEIIDHDNGTYVQWSERETKTRHGDENQQGAAREFAPKMFRNQERPDRCPIEYFKLFQSKRPASMKMPESPFYLAINYNRRSESAMWYKKSPMGADRISHIMSRMAKKAGLVGKFSNHSVRRTMCSQLIRSGFHPNLVSQLSGHRSVSSLARYATASIEQQRQMCQILQGNNNQARSASISHTEALSEPPPHKKIRALSVPAPPSMAIQSHPQKLPQSSNNNMHASTEVNASGNLLQGLFSGASFSHIGTINVHVHK